MWFVAGALTERTQRWKGYKRGEVEGRHNERKYGKTKYVLLNKSEGIFAWVHALRDWMKEQD